MSAPTAAVMPRPYASQPGPARRLDGPTLRISHDGDLAPMVATLGRLARRALGIAVHSAHSGEADIEVAHVGPLPTPAAAMPPATGISPRPGGYRDERYAIAPVGDRLVLHPSTTDATFRGLTTVLQLLYAEPDGGWFLQQPQLHDGPAYRWRGLCLDVARHFVPIADLERIVDLLAWYKLNVLHLHLSDNEAWRLQVDARPGLTTTPVGPDPRFYTAREFTQLFRYAADRFLTVVPELDMPGHTRAAVAAYPNLAHGASAPYPLLPYLSPLSRAALDFVRDVVTEVAALSPAPYLHIGGDEAIGMPPAQYAAMIGRIHRAVHDAGKAAVGWQEVSRADTFGAGDAVQLWMSPHDPFDGAEVKRDTPERYHPLVDLAGRSFRLAAGDLERAAARGIPVIASPTMPLYLDRRYAEPSRSAPQRETLRRVGFPRYRPQPSRAVFGWRPDEVAEVRAAGVAVAGVEAALWTETVDSFADLALLLLPRLAIVAEWAWLRDPGSWPDFVERIGSHPGVWERLGFAGFYQSVDVFPDGVGEAAR